MLYEFNDSVKTLSDILDKYITILDGEAPDDIDLSELASEASDLASTVFIVNDPQIPSKVLSRKEAYDFVLGLSRLNTIYNQDRAHYYETSSDNTVIEKRYLVYLATVLKNIDRFSGVADS